MTLILYLVVNILSLHSLSAQGAESDFPSGIMKEPGVTRTPPLIGYGLVNNWFLIDSHKLGKLLSQNGLTLTGIEYVAWFDEEGRKGQSIRTDLEAAKQFVKVMRSYSVTTLIIVVNWNSEGPRKASDDWFLKQVREIRDQIGPEKVLLLPVSEPDGSDKAKAWQASARREWPGKIVLNGPGGRGIPNISGKTDYLDWHWCKDFDFDTVLTQIDGIEVINNTDCGPVINPGSIRAGIMTSAAFKKKAHFMVYDFEGVKIDEAVIQAMGQAIHEIPCSK